jgi:hypothetical protein
MERAGGNVDMQPNGAGVTNVIRRYLNSFQWDRDLIEKVILNDLNAIFVPDASYSRIGVEEHESQLWEIQLEEAGKGRVPMSHTGSGVKTVLMVLMNLFILPALTKRPLSDFLYGFEELENNLHPAIQRRLFRYLRERAVRDKCRFFVTTHSNVVIDLFTGDDQAQILHVKHDGSCASVATVETSVHGGYVLDDLDVRASDLLQTNAVVWVEGPSDRIYFNKWVELMTDGELSEGVHYQCLPFGGSANAHFSFDAPEDVEELVAAMRINRHAILLIDRDKAAAGEKLKPHTERLLKEIDLVGGYGWITAGKEVENYIPTDVFRLIWKNPNLKGPDPSSDVLEYVAKHEKKSKPKKVELARRISEVLMLPAISVTLDLKSQLDEVCKRIREWNSIGAGGSRGA